MERRRTSDPEYFWSKVDRSGGPDVCWPWMAGTGTGGYGITGWRDRGQPTRQHRAHRLAWTYARGPIPDGLDVLHHCDNRPCCNPDHLFLGGDLENSRDKVAKGRAARLLGQANGSARLSESDVREIRSLHPGTKKIDLARQYGVGESTIRRVLAHQNWQHVA